MGLHAPFVPLGQRTFSYAWILAQALLVEHALGSFGPCMDLGAGAPRRACVRVLWTMHGSWRRRSSSSMRQGPLDRAWILAQALLVEHASGSFGPCSPMDPAGVLVTSVLTRQPGFCIMASHEWGILHRYVPVM